MKKLVRVSLFVLMALMLSLAIGCKHDSDPEPAKEGSRTPFVGTWVDETGDVTCTINDDGTFVAEADKKYDGKYHVSPDGKTATVTITFDGKEVTFTLTSKSEDTLELTMPEDFYGEKMTLTRRVDADFAGEWKSTNGNATATLKDGDFTTVMDGEELKGTYTVVGKTATTSKMTIPAELAGGSEVSASFIMKMVDGNDVMKLTVTHGEPFDMTFVKKSIKEFDLTGTWTGKVVSENNADATISFDNNGATLRSGGATVVSTNVNQNGNFFTITWQEGNPLDLSESTGLVSASGKAWLDDGSVFTKQQ